MKLNEHTRDSQPVDFEDAVSKTGFGWYNIMLLIVCGISLMSVIMETMSMSFVLPAAQCDLHLTLSDKGTLSSVGFLGVVLSSLLWGFIGDTTGRRKVVLITTYISLLAGIASSLSPFTWLFIILRFINCFFIGGSSAVIIAYLGEFHGAQYRARVISASGAFVGIASVVLSGLAWIILPMDWSFEIPSLNILYRPWRLLIILYGLPSFISATSLLFLPESPKYLWAAQKPVESLKILRMIYAFNTRKAANTFPVKRLTISHENTKDVNGDSVNFRSGKIISSVFKLLRVQLLPIFKPPLWIRTFLTSFLQFGILAGSGGFLIWLPELLNRVSQYLEVTNAASVTICEAMYFKKQFDSPSNVTEISLECTDNIDTEVFRISLIIGAVFALLYLSIGTVINYTGKKRLLVGLVLFTGFAGIAANFMVSYILISAMTGLFIIGGAGVTILNTVVVDLFPTQYRSIAMSVSLMAGRTGAVSASYIIGYLLEYSCPTTFYLYGGGYVLLALTALLLPST